LEKFATAFEEVVAPTSVTNGRSCVWSCTPSLPVAKTSSASRWRM
jgi:hypothetical protein